MRIRRVRVSRSDHRGALQLFACWLVETNDIVGMGIGARGILAELREASSMLLQEGVKVRLRLPAGIVDHGAFGWMAAGHPAKRSTKTPRSAAGVEEPVKLAHDVSYNT
jgi:hypothetical protein